MKSISIHLTDTCNNSCKFCVVNSHRESKEQVNLRLIKEFLKANANKGYETVNLHGGEPTIVPELIEILDMINDLGYASISIQTNGRKLRDYTFTKSLIERNVDVFVISLHGKDAKMHDFFTQTEGSFDEAIEGIKVVKSFNKKVRTNTCVCKQNYDQMVDIVEKAMELGVDHINISNLHTTKKAYENFHEVVPKLFDVIDYVKEAVDAVVKKGRDITLEGYVPCVLGDYSKYSIDWDENNYKLLFRDIVVDNYSTFMDNVTRKKGKPCRSCIHEENCGGLYKEYAMIYGWHEINPIEEQEEGA